jgi:pyruvate/2-oxoglutarate dehydrogenase complex dihydrolipoamide dehydrogenase (E3) component
VRADRAGRTGAAHVWAAGDVTGPALFAISVAEAGAALAVHDAWNSISVGAAR